MDFNQLLASLQSPDNAVRTQAEKFYNEGKAADPNGAVSSLVGALATCPDLGTRSMAAVLLRKLVAADAKRKLEPATMAGAQRALQNAFESESSAAVRRKIAFVIAPLACTSFMTGTWGELLPALFDRWLPAADAARRESAFLLAGLLCEYCREHMFPHVERLRAALVAGLDARSGLAVRAAAVAAAASLLTEIGGEGTEADRAPFEALLPPMIAVVADALNAGDERTARDALERLIDLVQRHCAMFKPCLPALVQGMSNVVRAREQLEGATRKLGMEVLVVLTREGAGMARRCPTLVEALTPLCVGLLKEVDFECDFDASAYGEDDEDCDAPSVIGRAALSRLVESLGRQLVKPVTQHAVALVASPSSSPQERWAGLTALQAALSSGSRAFVKKVRQDCGAISSVASTLARDASQPPAVQHAAIVLIASLCAEFGESGFQASPAGRGALEAVVQAMTAPGSTLNVRGTAASCVTCFAAPGVCDEEALPPAVLRPLLSSLCALLQACQPMGDKGIPVQEEALKAVACVASVVETDFAEYYDSFMPGLKQILSAQPNQNPTAAAGLRSSALRARALECLGLIVEGVGAAATGLPDIMRLLQPMLERMARGEVGTSDPQALALSQCCVHVCKAMGPSFAPYLPHIVPALLRQAAVEVNYTVADVDPDAAAAGGASDAGPAGASGVSSVVMNIRGFGNKQISLNTCAIEEKHQAVLSLMAYAECLRGAFAPYVEDALRVVLGSCLSFAYFPGVRSASALCLPQLLRAGVAGLAQSGSAQLEARGAQLLERVVPPLLERLSNEAERGEPDDIACAAEAVKQAMEVCYRSGASSAEAEELEPPFLPAPSLRPPLALCRRAAGVLVACAAASVQRRMEQQAAAQSDPYFDAEAAERLEEDLEEEGELMTQCVDGIGYMIKCWKADLLGVVAEAGVVQLFQKMLDPKMPAALRINGVCVFDDIVEHCGAEAHARFVPSFLGVVLEASGPQNCANTGGAAGQPTAAQSQNASACDRGLQQCALYGIGQIAAKAPQLFAPRAAEALTVLERVAAEFRAMPAGSAEREEAEEAADNAVGAIGRICFSHAEALGSERVARLMRGWTQALPLKGDVVEARVVHSQLAGLVAERHPLLLASSENGGAAHNRSDGRAPFSADVVRASVEIVSGAAEADSKARATLARALASVDKTCLEAGVRAASLSASKQRRLAEAMQGAAAR
jgi:hypothetical protein